MSSSKQTEQEPRAQNVKLDEEALTVDLVDGRSISAPLAWYPRLLHANPTERSNFEIFGDDTHVHWPEVDEDLTVLGILEGRRSAESQASVEKWLFKRDMDERGTT